MRDESKEGDNLMITGIIDNIFFYQAFIYCFFSVKENHGKNENLMKNNMQQILLIICKVQKNSILPCFIDMCFSP